MFGIGWFEIFLVLLLAALVALAVWPNQRPARVSDEVFVPHLSADAVDSALLRELADVPGWDHVRAHGRVHQIERKYVPGISVFVAILAFPIGLVALLWRNRFTAEISVVDAEGGCRLRFVGTASRKDVNALARAVQRAAPSVRVLI